MTRHNCNCDADYGSCVEVDSPVVERIAPLLIALRDQWRESAVYEAENANMQYGQALDQCADDLDAALFLNRMGPPD